MKPFILISFLSSLLFASCTDEECGGTLPAEEPGVVLSICPEGVTATDTRTATPEMGTPDGKVEKVVVYAFNASGQLVAGPKEQELDYPDNLLHMILPTDKEGDLTLHAVCNVDELWPGITLSELQAKVREVEKASDVFKGCLEMHGSATFDVEKLKSKETLVIPVRRLSAKILLDIRFKPNITGEKFYPTAVKVGNQPKRSWLIGRGVINFNDSIASKDDCIYADGKENMKGNYLPEQPLPFEELEKDVYSAQFYQYENRRGAATAGDAEKWFNQISDANPDKPDLLQIFKREMAEELTQREFSLGSYIKIEGMYERTGGAVSKVSYTIYLGSDNYRDFNIYRNSRYCYYITIRDFDDVDTRVDGENLDKPTLEPSFEQPLDAHFNSGKCFVYVDGDWEMYVEDADRTPWLELSRSPFYRPRPLGMTDQEAKDKRCATTYLSGEDKFVGYVYIHTDEYVPYIDREADNVNDKHDYLEQQAAYRTGTIVLRNKSNHQETRFSVTQRPAQVVCLTRRSLLGKVEYHWYYVEHTLEKKNMQWGFLKYGANPNMTSMMNDRWDGLSNTRKLYDEAIRPGGMYNPGEETTEAAPGNLPDDIALGYAVSKNRDRDGNGYIDWDEIVWYLPAPEELAELRRVIDDSKPAYNLWFDNNEDKFWSSTPYLAGYTDAIPGRAFYVKMRGGKKDPDGKEIGEISFAMRDRYYNVVCVRRKNAWKENAESNAGADVDIDDGWGSTEDEIVPKPNGNQ